MALAARAIPQATPSIGRDIQSLGKLERAIVEAVLYADIFDYPLNAAEIHRYLPHVEASANAVACALPGLVPHFLEQQDGFYVLPGRVETVAIRQQRAEYARRLWSRAGRYARIIAALPFVRMVAVTGSLAMDNVEAGGDIDYLIVTEPGRLWLCRALVILVVRAAAQRNDPLCPNYFVSQQALRFPEQNLYTARELVQMVPLVGLETYAQLRRLNDWSARFLPNASGPPRQIAENGGLGLRWRGLAEAALRTPAGGWLEAWEMGRKIEKFTRQQADYASGSGRTEAQFGADWCRGHFEGHGQRTLGTFARRLRELGSDLHHGGEEDREA